MKIRQKIKLEMYQRDRKWFVSFQQYIEREEGKERDGERWDEMRWDERIEKQDGEGVLRLRSNGSFDGFFIDGEPQK